MSEVLTNNAAAAIMYPIAASLADQLGIHPNTMSVAVMLGGSAGWILPYSYQCNLMVYAAGKYETKDFIKIGTPYYVSALQLLLGTNLVYCVTYISPTSLVKPTGVVPSFEVRIFIAHSASACYLSMQPSPDRKDEINNMCLDPT
jgi:Na+/H+ antiporter NhaC